MWIPKFRKRKSQLLFNRLSTVLFLCYVYFSLSSKLSYLDIYIFVRNTFNITLNRNMILWHFQLLYPNVSILWKLVEYTFFYNVIDKNLSIMWYMNGLFHHNKLLQIPWLEKHSFINSQFCTPEVRHNTPGPSIQVIARLKSKCQVSHLETGSLPGSFMLLE